MRRLFAFAASIAAASTIVLAPAAGAAECPGAGTPTAVGPFYVVIDKNGDQWIYQESNGVPNLQRGGKGGATGMSSEDSCADKTAKKPDTIIF